MQTEERGYNGEFHFGSRERENTLNHVLEQANHNRVRYTQNGTELLNHYDSEKAIMKIPIKHSSPK